jgi:hypothetical protein
LAVSKENDDRGQGDDSGRSRREFLKKAPAFIAGGMAMGVVAGRLALSRVGRRRRPPVVPEGSIFTPAASPEDRA